MIHRIAFLFGLLFAAPAFAADNATLITPCASGCVTMRSKDIGAGVQSMIQILGDTSGNAIYGTAGTANANVLSVQGIASGTALSVSAASLPLPTGAATSALQTTGNTALTTINTTLGTPFQAGGSIGNTAFIANAGTNLNTSALGTSANQTSQITQETTTATGVGTPTDAVCSAPATQAGSCTMEALLKALLNTGQYPSGAVATNGSATGTTTATATTLAATASVTQYACWISIRANANAVATNNATLSDGTKTFNFTQWTAPNASGIGVVEEVFNPCIPATAVNTAWTLTSGAAGTGGVVSVAIGGYKL